MFLKVLAPKLGEKAAGKWLPFFLANIWNYLYN